MLVTQSFSTANEKATSFTQFNSCKHSEPGCNNPFHKWNKDGWKTVILSTQLLPLKD